MTRSVSSWASGLWLDLKIIAPWRDDKWTMDPVNSRLNTARRMALTCPSPRISPQPRPEPWHISHEGLELEDPANEPNHDHLLVPCYPGESSGRARVCDHDLEKGVPTSVNGKKMKVSDIIRELNRLGGKHGIGIVDIVENPW